MKKPPVGRWRGLEPHGVLLVGWNLNAGTGGNHDVTTSWDEIDLVSWNVWKFSFQHDVDICLGNLVDVEKNDLLRAQGMTVGNLKFVLIAHDGNKCACR